MNVLTAALLNHWMNKIVGKVLHSWVQWGICNVWVDLETKTQSRTSILPSSPKIWGVINYCTCKGICSHYPNTTSYWSHLPPLPFLLSSLTHLPSTRVNLPFAVSFGPLPLSSLSLSLSGVLYLPCDATVLTIYSDTFLTKPHLQSFINYQRLHFNHGFYNHEIIQSNGLNSTINYTVHTRRARVAVPMSVSGQLRLEIPHHHQSDAPTLFSLSFSL